MANSMDNLTTVDEHSGQHLSMVGDNYRLVITGEQTGGAYAIIDMLVPPGGGPGPHAHPDFQESYLVLEGEVEFKTEHDTYTAHQGDFINIPLGGVVHQFKNKSGNRARLWCTVVPAGLDAFFREVGVPVEGNTILPSPPMGPEEMKRLQALADKHGQTLLPPDYLD